MWLFAAAKQSQGLAHHPADPATEERRRCAMPYRGLLRHIAALDPGVHRGPPQTLVVAIHEMRSDRWVLSWM